MRKSEPSNRDPLYGLVVYEDRDIVVVNKPPQMLTASGPKDKRLTLWGVMKARGAAQRLQMGIIHRLDRDASGLLVFSKNDEAYHSLKTQFFKHTVDRVYLAIVSGKPKPASAKLRSNLIEWKDGTVHSTKQPNKGEVAISHYEVCSVEGNHSLVRIKLETGRKHQIRVHMADLGFPIVGDVLYEQLTRKQKKDPAKDLMLVAIRLCFNHPATDERMEFEIDMPQHMRDFLRQIRPQTPPPQPTLEQPAVLQPGSKPAAQLAPKHPAKAALKPEFKLKFKAKPKFKAKGKFPPKPGKK